jgi:4'-phosphopantetheinyl transferase
LLFATGSNGKPLLPSGKVFFNVSHSSDVALYAVSRNLECGIDVEEVRDLPDLDAIAERLFSPQECLALSELAKYARISAFFLCWTRKESVIKATGIGLSLSL